MKNEKEEYVFRVFQSIAEGYDSANRRISLGAHLRWKKSAVKSMMASLPEGAALLDIGPAHLSNLERGRRDPSFALLAAIGVRLNVSLDYLVLGRPDERRAATFILRSDEELLAEVVAK